MRTIMSKEEKARRIKKRLKEKKALYEKLPYARLGDYNVYIHIDPGEDIQMEVRDRDKRGELLGTIIIGNDLKELATFIRALVARYNALVDSLNETAAKCHIKTADKMSTPPL